MGPRTNIRRLTPQLPPDFRTTTSEPSGLEAFREVLDLVDAHLSSARAHLMPALAISGASDEVVGFQFIRDRRRYLAHVIPFRERRKGHPRFRGPYAFLETREETIPV
jgi:hypothetical protein